MRINIKTCFQTSNIKSSFFLDFSFQLGSTPTSLSSWQLIFNFKPINIAFILGFLLSLIFRLIFFYFCFLFLSSFVKFRHVTEFCLKSVNISPFPLSLWTNFVHTFFHYYFSYLSLFFHTIFCLINLTCRKNGGIWMFQH